MIYVSYVSDKADGNQWITILVMTVLSASLIALASYSVVRRIRKQKAIANSFEKLNASGNSEAYQYGEEKGDNSSLRAAIEYFQRQFEDEHMSACRSTGRGRRTTWAPRSDPGERESGTARLEEAVAAYRAALEE